MTNDQLPVIIVRNPLGVGIVCGLITTWLHTSRHEPGVYRVVQIAGVAVKADQQRLAKEAARRGLPLPHETVPWTFFLPGPVGLVTVSECRHYPGHELYAWELILASPRPAWEDHHLQTVEAEKGAAA